MIPDGFLFLDNTLAHGWENINNRDELQDVLSIGIMKPLDRESCVIDRGGRSMK